VPETLSSSRHKNFSRVLVDLALSKRLGGRKAEPFLREATELIARTIAAERTSVWLFEHKGKSLRCVDLFERGLSRHSKGTELAMADYPTYFSSLRKRRAIAAHDAHRDHRTREFSESYLTPLKITSMLDAPIRSGGKLIGLLCIEHTGPRRRWSAQEQSFAASAADLIALNFENAERQRAVAELERSEDRYRALAENFPHGAVLMFDRDLRYVVAHGASLADTNLRIDSLVGRTIFESLPPEISSILEPHYRKALAGTESAFEISVGKRVFEVHTVPVRSIARRVTFAMAMAHDITDHVRAEEEIRKSHRLLNDAQAIASLGVFEWRARENKVTWSDSLHMIFGSTPEDTPQTLDGYLQRVHPEDRDRVRDGIYQAYSTGSTFAQEERIIRTDGMIRELATKGTAATDANGRVTGLVGICQDITEIKEAHRVLSEYNRTLEEQVADRTRELRERQLQLVQSAKMVSLGNLVAGVAHEINSPLGAMLANWDIVRYAATQLREVAADKADLLPLIDSIVDAERIGISAGQRINGIVSSLRNFARLDQAIEDETDIHELIESTLPLVAHLMKNRIEVRREYAKIPRVRCYPAKLNQVWMNLIVNAAQAIEGRGEIRIQTYTRNSHAVVAISDSGAGIPPESRARIFDPGFTTKGVKVGMGLGLAIVHGIIEEHQGTIEVESEVGRGSTFRVSLPIRLVPKEVLPVADGH
jgi:PAS domain S-box-containing protein